MTDHNPRPLKRQRVESIKDASNPEKLSSIPPSTLLLALPSILVHPPTHPDHQSSLQLSSTALKKCLELPEVEGNLECRAWTALAEVGIIEGMQEPGTAEEVEKAISKAVRMHLSLSFVSYLRIYPAFDSAEGTSCFLELRLC